MGEGVGKCLWVWAFSFFLRQHYQDETGRLHLYSETNCEKRYENKQGDGLGVHRHT